MSFDPKLLQLYAVTDRQWTGRQTLIQQLEAALQGGVTLVQLREKDLDDAAFLAEAREVVALCHRYGVPCLINDNLPVALAAGADGVHVGQEDQPVADIRRQVGPDFLIGATAKTLDQALAAQAAGADYLRVGACFPSPTKPNAKGITREALADICAAVSLPVVAIGGITLQNARQLQGVGMAGLAVISALFAAPDITTAARDLLALSRHLTEGGAP